MPGLVSWQILLAVIEPPDATGGGNVPTKELSYGEKIANIGAAHTEIFDEICGTMK